MCLLNVRLGLRVMDEGSWAGAGTEVALHEEGDGVPAVGTAQSSM